MGIRPLQALGAGCRTCPDPIGLIWSDLVRSGAIWSDLVGANLVWLGLILSDLISWGMLRPIGIGSDRVWPGCPSGSFGRRSSGARDLGAGSAGGVLGSDRSVGRIHLLCFAPVLLSALLSLGGNGRHFAPICRQKKIF